MGAGVASVVPIELPALEASATHHQIAEHWLAQQQSPGLVACEAAFWRFDDGTRLWGRLPLERVEIELGARYSAQKSCRRKSDYAQIAAHAYNVALQPAFFESALPGLAAPDGFHCIVDDALACEPLTPELRQRFALQVVPTRVPSPVWDGFLGASFSHPDVTVAVSQEKLAQEVFGAAITGLLHSHEKAAFLIGPGGSGKSTFLRVLEELMPPEVVCAVSPFKWDDEYHIAAMAGKRLNLVGELPGDKAIPAHAFKLVTGRDRVTGRWPHGRPFDFRPLLGHIFNGNAFIPTRDHSSGFWRRWLVLGFDNPVPEHERDKDIDRRIIDGELEAVLWWALQGAERVARNDGFTHSLRADELLDRWRTATDAVAEFLRDEEAVQVAEDANVERTDLYAAFRDWARESGRKAMGRSPFYVRVEQLGYRAKKVQGVRMFEGLRLA